MFASKSIVGLDVSDLVLRAVTLSPGRPQPTLTAYQEMLLPAGLIDDGEIQKQEEVGQRIRTLLQHALPSSIRQRQVVACLPDRRTFVKLLELPTMDRERIPAAIRKVLPQHIPFRPDEVYFDWHHLPTGDGRKLSLLVGAAPKLLVEQYLETIERAGLTVVALEMESIALARALLIDQLPTKATLIVDLGGTRTTVVALGRGSILFSSSLPFSGTNFTQRIAESLKVPFEEAEKLKARSSVTGRSQSAASKALVAPLEQLAAHLREIMHYFATTDPNAGEVESLLLCGGGAQLRGIDTALASRVDRVVEIRAPRVRLGRGVSIHPARLPSYTTAVGLALHRVL